jgi:hypothetical protein
MLAAILDDGREDLVQLETELAVACPVLARALELLVLVRERADW